MENKTFVRSDLHEQRATFISLSLDKQDEQTEVRSSRLGSGTGVFATRDLDNRTLLSLSRLPNDSFDFQEVDKTALKSLKSWLVRYNDLDRIRASVNSRPVYKNNQVVAVQLLRRVARDTELTVHMGHVYWLGNWTFDELVRRRSDGANAEELFRGVAPLTVCLSLPDPGLQDVLERLRPEACPGAEAVRSVKKDSEYNYGPNYAWALIPAMLIVTVSWIFGYTF